MKIVLLQTAPIHDPAIALEAVESAAADAASMNADVLVTPELMLGGYDVGSERIRKLALQSEKFIGSLERIAQKYNIAVVGGLATSGSPKPYNTAVVIDTTGKTCARYYKTHLFGDVDRAQFTAGPALPAVFELNGWRVGLAICYDIEFPELCRHLAEHDAELILTPTANMKEYPSVPQRLTPARAQENGLFIAYANYVGAEGRFTYGGLSCIHGPDGNQLASGSATDPSLVVATLERQALLDARIEQNYLADRRIDLYGDPGRNAH